MNLKIRKISGSLFTSDDILEVVLDSDNTPLSYVTLTLISTSGSDVTHGGGAPAGEYLHYKAVERDGDDDGIIDYSNSIVKVNQLTQGLSTVKVLAKIMTVENATALQEAVENDINTPNEGELGEEILDEDYEVIVESSEITLEWREDSFV